MSARLPEPVWLAGPTRFAGLPWRLARIAAAGIILLVLASLLALHTRLAIGSSPAEGSDLDLYASIVDALRHGGSYYRTAADALRAGGYPLRPFVTFRLPTLAVVQAAAPPWLVVGCLWLLALAVAATWMRRLRAVLPRVAPRIAAAMLLAGGLVAHVQPVLAPFHEIWAGLLIAWSLALRRPGHWIEAAAVALAAMLVRETAALYAVVMMVLAWRDGKRREASGWAATIIVFAVAIAAHATAVAQVVRPLDPASPGWAGMLGFGYFVRTQIAATTLAILPTALSAPLVALALVGWAGWRDPLAVRTVATLAAYALLLSVFSRADTFYWGLLVAPVLLVGLVFVPDVARDLARAALDRRRITVTRVVR